MSDFAFLRARGLARGTLAMWDKDVLWLLSSSCGNFSRTCVFLLVNSGLSWAFNSVYGPHSREDKLKFWEELCNIRDAWSGPWCITGNFNKILQGRERDTA